MVLPPNQGKHKSRPDSGECKSNSVDDLTSCELGIFRSAVCSIDPCNRSCCLKTEVDSGAFTTSTLVLGNKLSTAIKFPSHTRQYLPTYDCSRYRRLELSTNCLQNAPHGQLHPIQQTSKQGFSFEYFLSLFSHHFKQNNNCSVSCLHL